LEPILITLSLGVSFANMAEKNYFFHTEVSSVTYEKVGAI
jgi:hypothetical protein